MVVDLTFFCSIGAILLLVLLVIDVKSLRLGLDLLLSRICMLNLVCIVGFDRNRGFL